MPRKQVTTKAINISTWEQCDEALMNIATMEAQIQEEEGAYNKQEQEQRAVLTAKHAPMKEKIDQYAEGMKLFCLANKLEFGDKKSKELNHGIVSFRLHPPKVNKLKGMTWDAVIRLVEASKKWAKEFIRTKVELDKENIIASKANGTIKDSELVSLGIEVEQDETFGYTIKNAVV